MIIDHTHPEYRKRRLNHKIGKYNGAYYYSKEIVKYIIPNVETDRHWVTINQPVKEDISHGIVFIHNNINPNRYKWLQDFDDLILICGVPSTTDNMRFYGRPIYLPLSVKVDEIAKYRLKNKTKEVAFAGRIRKINNRIPSQCDRLSELTRSELLKEMAHYKQIYAVGRTAIEAKILGCEILVYDERFPDPKFWQILDSLDAAKMLQEKLYHIDGK